MNIKSNVQQLSIQPSVLISFIIIAVVLLCKSMLMFTFIHSFEPTKAGVFLDTLTLLGIVIVATIIKFTPVIIDHFIPKFNPDYTGIADLSPLFDIQYIESLEMLQKLF